MAGLAGPRALTASDSAANNVAVGKYIQIICTVAGNVVLVQPAGLNTVPVAVGLTVLPYAVMRVNTTSTTATATYANID